MVAEWWSNGIYPLVICYIALEKGPLIVDLPIKDGDFPVRYVSLPEGIIIIYQLYHVISTYFPTFWWLKPYEMTIIINQPGLKPPFSYGFPMIFARFSMATLRRHDVPGGCRHLGFLRGWDEMWRCGDITSKKDMLGYLK